MLFAFLAVYLVSIALALPDASFGRVLATANTFTLWIVVTITSATIAVSTDTVDMERIEKYAFINLTVLAVVMLATQAMHLNPTLPWDGKQLWKSDWLNGDRTMRFTGLLGYSNAVVFWVLLLLPYSIRFGGGFCT